MGKQGRKKNRQKRRQQEHRNDDPSAQSSATSKKPSSAVHQLRHVDPKIRQNALVALQANIIHNSSRLMSVEVLQAIREQVMDPNFECASAAAECLALYLSHTPNLEHQAVTTASWTPVLISRLDQCLKAIQNDAKKPKQWYAVAGPCVKTLCRLVEANERALEYILSSTTQMDTFLVTLFGLLHAASTFEKTTDILFNEWVKETVIYSARTLHSSLDDNHDMAERINASSHYSNIDAWTQLFPNLPNLSIIHLCGSLITMHQITPATWQSSLLVHQALPCLCKNLIVNPDQLQSMELAFAEALTLRKSQKEDEELEGDIVRKIQDRKEPARVIARRQKDVDRGSKSLIQETKDGEQALDEAIEAWSNVMTPLQLALEVAANLLSTFIREDEHMDEDEAQLDKTTHLAMISARFAESLVKAVQMLCSYQERRGEPSKDHEALSDDIEESISKASACVTNSILSQVLEPCNFEATWQVLRPFIMYPGVSSIFVVFSKQGLPLAAQDTAVIQQLLESSSEESQRDGVALLLVMMNNPLLSAEIVAEGTQKLLHILNHGQPIARIESLHAVMELWGQDEYHPQIFATQQILKSFQATLATLSADKNLDPEAEDVLFNAGRFVDYKLGR